MDHHSERLHEANNGWICADGDWYQARWLNAYKLG
jgi:hypothetical protein